jgi:hypothetical protein
MDELRLDGNAAAGTLGEVFSFEVPTADYTCEGCGKTDRLGAAMVSEVRGIRHRQVKDVAESRTRAPPHAQCPEAMRKEGMTLGRALTEAARAPTQVGGCLRDLDAAASGHRGARVKASHGCTRDGPLGAGYRHALGPIRQARSPRRASPKSEGDGRGRIV